MPLIFRGPPYDDGSPSTQPWGSGQGSPLLEWQVDNNFYVLSTQVQTLTENQTAGIDYFVINGNLLYVHLTDHTVLGGYVLPMWTPVPVGEWMPDTPYVSNNVVYYNGATYLVLFNHTSPASWNPYYEVGGNACYSPPILVCPGDVLPLGGEPGQVLTVTVAGGSELPEIDWAYILPSGGTAGNFLKLVTPGTSDTAAVTEWVVPPTVEELSNFILSSPEDAGQVLIFNGTDWTNALPLASDSQFGFVEVDGTTIISSGGVISAVGGGGGVAPGAIYGLTTSPDSSPSQTLNIAAGQATDSTGATTIVLGAFTKSLSGAWTAGSGNGGMGQGLTVTADTWYHVFLIENDSVADIYFDTDPDAANTPAGTTAFRRIWSIWTDGSPNILPYGQNGGDGLWATPVVEVSSSTISSGGQAVTLTGTPPGVATKARLWIQLAYQTNSDVVGIVTTYQADHGPNFTTTGFGFNISVATDVLTWQTDVWTDATPKVYLQSQNQNCLVNLNTEGWHDDRGQYTTP